VDLEIRRHPAERLRLAHEIGQAKIERGLPVRDYRMETETLARTARRCLEIELDPRLGTEIVPALMRGAVRVQEDLRERVYGGALQQVLLVGGRGKMGTCLARYFNAQGHPVCIFDTAGPLDGFASPASLEEGCETADVLVLAAPLSESVAVYESVLATTRDRPDLLIAGGSSKEPRCPCSSFPSRITTP
jgi:chorismate mutase